MANTLRGEFEFEFDGKEYTFLPINDAVQGLEQELICKGLQGFFRDAIKEDFLVSDVITILYYLLEKKKTKDELSQAVLRIGAINIITFIILPFVVKVLNGEYVEEQGEDSDSGEDIPQSE